MDDDPLSKVRKKTLDCVKRIQEIAFELRDIADNQLIQPTPDEIARMISGKEKISYQAHLAGMLWAIRGHLSEVGEIVEAHGRMTPKTFRNMAHWSYGLLRNLTEPLPGSKEWDKRKV